MHYIYDIIRMNDKAAEKALAKKAAESETSRLCSYSGDSASGVVLHSAKQRNTVFLKAGRPAAQFIARWFSVNSDEARNKLVESYF